MGPPDRHKCCHTKTFRTWFDAGSIDRETSISLLRYYHIPGSRVTDGTYAIYIRAVNCFKVTLRQRVMFLALVITKLLKHAFGPKRNERYCLSYVTFFLSRIFFIVCFITFYPGTCMVCSVLTLAAISCDRFMAVFFPLHVRVTKQRKPLVVSLVWILSVVVSIPYIVSKKMQITEWKDFQQKKCTGNWGDVRYKHESLGACVVKGSLFITQTILMTIFIYLLPITIMIIAYIFILWKLSRTQAPGEQLAANDNIDSSGVFKRVHKMVFTVLVVFAICWTPYHVSLLYDLTHPKSIDFPKWWTATYAWIVWLIEMGNSMMNPIIYAGMKQEFRQGIFAVLRCRKPIIRAKPPQNKRRAMAVGNKHQPKEVNLELEMKGPVAEGP